MFDSNTRTSKSIINASVNIFFYVLQMLLGFWYRKVFYDYLGSEVLGLDTTAQSLLNFLNIAESGVGVAVAYFLYEPLFANDHEKISKIVALQGWIYRRIATFILVASICLMFFFPLIFNNIQVPLRYAYAIFSVLLIGNLLGYYVNYRQCVLSADQKTYKVTKVTQLVSVLFKILLIVTLPYVDYPFLLYIGTTFTGYIVSSIWLNYTIRKEYPWLNDKLFDGRNVIDEYPEIIKKTKQLFLHQVASFIIFQCSPLIMYSFSSLTIIAYYGNYLLVTENLKSILKQAFSSTNAAIGNLIASRDKERLISVFWELTDSRLCFSTIVFSVVYLCIDPFISIWLSPDYLLDKFVLILTLVIAWLFVNRLTIDGFKSGFGIYDDVWAPFAEGIINLVVAVVAGYIYGIGGVLLGSVSSYILIVYLWKPYYLYKKGFKMNPLKYFFLPFAKRIIIIFASLIAYFYISSVISLNADSFIDLLMFAFMELGISSVMFYSLFFVCTDGMKSFHRRITKLIKQNV